MELGERQRRILQAVIDDYIACAEPVGSRSISKNHELGLSSATIRNEMADLEELGYLTSPHTSAGRIPTDLGYRFYVDELMRRYRMSAHIAALLTNYTTVVVTPEFRQSYVKRFEILAISPNEVLLVLVTSEGIIKNQLIRMRNNEESIKKLSSILNQELTGLTLEQISLAKISELQRSLGNSIDMMAIVNFISQSITELDGSDVYVSKAHNILEHPEYRDVDKAKGLINFLEDKESLKNVVDQNDRDSRINIVIGSESKFDQMQKTSIVTAKYAVGGTVVGKIGIVGPTRMDYAKVVTSLDSIAKHIDII